LVVLLGKRQVGMNPWLGWAICSHQDMYGRADLDSTFTLCLRHISFTLTHPPGWPNHQWSTCHPVVFLTLVCAQSYLVAMVLARALFPWVAKRIQVQNKFPVWEHRSPNAPRLPQRSRAEYLPRGKRLPHHLFWMELSWSTPQIVRNGTT
jgi:hypothetical protein